MNNINDDNCRYLVFDHSLVASKIEEPGDFIKHCFERTLAQSHKAAA